MSRFFNEAQVETRVVELLEPQLAHQDKRVLTDRLVVKRHYDN